MTGGTLIPLTSADGAQFAARLHETKSGDRGTVVMAAGFASSANIGLHLYVPQYLERGYNVLAFDYRTFGESPSAIRNVLSVRGQLRDWRSAIRFARYLERGNDSRIIVWGVSLSAAYALHMAAEIDGLGGCLLVMPNTDLMATARRNLGVLGVGVVIRLALGGVLDGLLAGLGRGRYYVPIVADRSSAKPAFIIGSDAFASMQSIADGPWDNRVTASIALRLPAYRPVRYWSKVRAPVHISYGTYDQYASIGPLLARVGSRDATEVFAVDGDHWAAWTESETISARQMQFLERYA